MVAPLDGQVALVTGAGRGLGRALARELAREGASVAMVSRTTGQVLETAKLIEAAGGRALAITADVSDARAIENAVKQTYDRLGPIDLLVNNAATAGPLGRLWETTPDDWRQAFETNVIGTMICCRTVLPEMVEREQGRILNIVSLAAARAGPGFGAYAASKAAVVRLTEGLAREIHSSGVTAFAVDPGIMETEMLRKFLEHEDTGKFYRHGALGKASASTPAKAVSLCLRLAAGEGDAFSGRFLSVTDNFDDLLARSEMMLLRDYLTLRRRTGPAG